MNDKEALAFRALVHKYGVEAMIVELTRVVAAYARTSAKWHIVKQTLNSARLIAVGTAATYDELELDSNESGRPLRSR